MTIGPIVVGDYAWIASNAIILPDVTIGEGTVVGAGAVVRRNVPPFSVVVDNPANETSSRCSKVLDYSPVIFVAPFEAWHGQTR
jgi:maltose O-acetyltransferase